MAFGIGANTQTADTGVVQGRQKDIACQCWFTSTGEIMPLMLKVKDEGGEIQVIKEITVHSKELKRYAGNPSIEFECTLWVREQRMRAKLIYYLLPDAEPVGLEFRMIMLCRLLYKGLLLL